MCVIHLFSYYSNMCVCVCVCNVSVVCVEIYYFKSSCLPYIQCMHLFHLAIIAVFCVLSYCQFMCAHNFVCACHKCCCVPAWSAIFQFGGVSLCLYARVCLCALRSVRHKCFCMAAWITTIQVGRLCLCAHSMMYITGVSYACMDCNIPV